VILTTEQFSLELTKLMRCVSMTKLISKKAKSGERVRSTSSTEQEGPVRGPILHPE